MAKKSKAQINRMIKRAEARGETYEPPPRQQEPDSGEPDKNDEAIHRQDETNPADKAKLQAARKLERELQDIENNESLKAKERRSAKRKAEAIASESVGCSATELMEWYEIYQKTHASAKSKKKSKASLDDKEDRRHKNPYIAFVGQLSFKTTKEALFKHIQTSLGEEFEVSDQTVKIRLLSDSKTGKSRGMAFVEVENPEILYALLRLHQTFLEGRRINVERSAGGKAHSQNKKQKLDQFRKEQEEYIGSVVDKMLQEFYQDGAIQPQELDEGVIALFKRHSANVVQAALERYVESNGKQKDNPSAYLTCLVGKMAEEGIFEREDDTKQDRRSGDKRSGDKRRQDNKRPTKKTRLTNNKNNTESVLEKKGVNMRAATKSTEKDVSRIFPSYNRGRGRGGKL